MKLRQRNRYNADDLEARAGELKVLIFDKNAQELLRHAKPFEARGFDVCKCLSVETAMRCVEREDFDFAVVDQGSEAFEGLRVVRHLVRYNLHTPFVFLSDSKDPRCFEQALALGAIAYLEKPFSMFEMNSIIEKYFGRLYEKSLT